ncbi:MAG: aminoacyl-tRNA hydrolase [Bdellovibrio sp. SCN 50-8]|nr:MAG: aminoacyl-tRNA hydrolase [Bdellovibrio sp. SCN 50-8]
MWLIAGLGNPGKEYAFTRHNIGFLAVDLWAEGLGVTRWSSEQKAEIAKVKWAGEDILFVKPQTFMNKSGESVQPLMQYYKIPLEKLIVVHDELDIPFENMKLQKNRGAGGHNGIKSISERLGTNDYIRMKVGIGRPAHPEMEVSAHVLGRFSKEEGEQLAPFLNWCGDAAETVIREGMPKASSLFNGAMKK